MAADLARTMILASTEHAAPVHAELTYKVTQPTDAFVRVYDKVIAPRDDAWLIDRKSIVGLSPESVQGRFNLSFTPRFICDASIPPGESVTACIVFGKDGAKARVFHANTRLQLSNERKLL